MEFYFFHCDFCNLNSLGRLFKSNYSRLGKSDRLSGFTKKWWSSQNIGIKYGMALNQNTVKNTQEKNMIWNTIEARHWLNICKNLLFDWQ